MNHQLSKVVPVLILLIGLAGFVFSFGANSVDARPPMQNDDPVEQGKYLASIARCITCHTPVQDQYNPDTNENYGEAEIRTVALFANDTLNKEMLMAGGRTFNLGPGGVVIAANITPDEETGIGSWTDEEIKTTIQTGVNPDGRRLHPIMPTLNTLAESDVDALVTYLRSLEPVSNEVINEVEVGAPPAQAPEEPIVAPTADDLGARGAYLVTLMNCTGCHTPSDPETGRRIQEQYLSGRQPFEGPYGILYAGNITPHENGIGNWSEEDIKRALTTGVRIDGRRLGLMPWQDYAALTAEDLDAVVYYLRNEVAPVDRIIPATALEEPYVQFVEGVGDENDEDEDDEDDFNSVLVAVVGGVVVILLGGGFMIMKRRSSKEVS